MSSLVIHIISGKTAILEIRNSPGDFGLFSISQDSYVMGYKDNPLFALEQSLVNERLYIAPLPDGRIIVRENIRLDKESEKWMLDSRSDDFSIFNH